MSGTTEVTANTLLNMSCHSVMEQISDAGQRYGLTLQVPENLCAYRASMGNPVMIDDYFDKLSETTKKLNIQDNLKDYIWNVVETGFMYVFFLDSTDGSPTPMLLLMDSHGAHIKPQVIELGKTVIPKEKLVPSLLVEHPVPEEVVPSDANPRPMTAETNPGIQIPPSPVDNILKLPTAGPRKEPTRGRVRPNPKAKLTTENTPTVHQTVNKQRPLKRQKVEVHHAAPGLSGVQHRGKTTKKKKTNVCVSSARPTVDDDDWKCGICNERFSKDKKVKNGKKRVQCSFCLTPYHELCQSEPERVAQDEKDASTQAVGTESCCRRDAYRCRRRRRSDPAPGADCVSARPTSRRRGRLKKKREKSGAGDRNSTCGRGQGDDARTDRPPAASLRPNHNHESMPRGVIGHWHSRRTPPKRSVALESTQ
ncbi:hypothetical protein PR048_002788 [Dryococelus australis]|uniref:Uncharacterized protein n=1 Tax=Dryococelus australis TaxID=614101 RepID=A0ABQ9ILU0_9NEOP|nr:hypothetical protein PR048_002788 [Dryococelus australis]